MGGLSVFGVGPACPVHDADGLSPANLLSHNLFDQEVVNCGICMHGHGLLVEGGAERWVAGMVWLEERDVKDQVIQTEGCTCMA